MLKGIYFQVVVLFLIGCATSSVIKKEETVTILLKEGGSIKGKITDISNHVVSFETNNWKKAYEYGETLNIERIKGIKLADGMVLSVKEFDSYRKGGQIVTRKSFAREKETQVETAQKAPDPLPRVQNKQPREEKAKVRQTRAVKRINPSSDETASFVNSLIETGLASSYLARLNRKSASGGSLDKTEVKIMKLIQNHPTWREKVEDIKFVDRHLRKTLERAVLYTPDELSEKLGLVFDPDGEFDYAQLMSQLHHRIGSDVKMRDLRVLVDVFGDSGGRAIKEVLQNYDTWRYVTQDRKTLVDK